MMERQVIVQTYLVVSCAPSLESSIVQHDVSYLVDNTNETKHLPAV